MHATTLRTPLAGLASTWSSMAPARRLSIGAVGTGAAVFSGAATAGLHGSVSAQALAYTGVFGLLAAAPAAAAGKAATAAAARRLVGTHDAGRAATLLDETRARTMAPAKVLAFGGGAVTAGVVAGNIAYRSAQGAVLEHFSEQHQQSRPAIKNETEAG